MNGKTKLSDLPFHVRASVCLGLWSGLAEVTKGYRVPKHLAQLTEQLILEAVNIPLDRARTCRLCGCTDNRACDGGCWWVADDLCSSCMNSRTRAVSGRPIDEHRSKRSKARLPQVGIRRVNRGVAR